MVFAIAEGSFMSVLCSEMWEWDNLMAAADRPQLRKAFCPFQKVNPGVRKVVDAGFNEVTEIRT